jgi:hypothetical protein
MMAKPKTWDTSLSIHGVASGNSKWFRGRLREINMKMEERTAVEATGKYTAP